MCLLLSSSQSTGGRFVLRCVDIFRRATVCVCAVCFVGSDVLRAVQVLSLRHVAGVVGGTDGPSLAPRKLRELRIEGDPHMRELPLAIDNLQHLKALSLRGCPRIAGLHLGLAQQTLQRLNICLCWELEAALPVEDLLAMPCLLELCTSQPLTSVRRCRFPPASLRAGSRSAAIAAVPWGCTRVVFSLFSARFGMHCGWPVSRCRGGRGIDCNWQ